MVDNGSGREGDPELRAVRDGGESLLTRIFGSLSHPRRRYVVYYLRDEEEATVDELAVVIVARERDVPRERAPEEAVKAVKTDLLHNHLPKLEDYKITEYDPRSETVTYTHRPPILDDIVDLAASVEKPP